MSSPPYSTMTPNTRMTSSTIGQERLQQTRKVSSTVIASEYIGQHPQDLPTREIEVQGPIQEVVRHVPRKEIVEIEKRVPKIEYEWVERIVEKPRIEMIDRCVEVPQYQEVIREVKVPKFIDQPREVIREVKVPRITYKEQVVEVPGEVIEVPKPYNVEQPVHYTRYTDTSIPVVVAQTLKPCIVEGRGEIDIDVVAYEPECIAVDIHVLKPVTSQIQSGGVVASEHRIVSVPAAQYNSMLQQLNIHLDQNELQRLPYVQTIGGSIEFSSEMTSYARIQTGVRIEGYDNTQPQITVHNGPRVPGALPNGVTQGPNSGGGVPSMQMHASRPVANYGSTINYRQPATNQYPAPTGSTVPSSGVVAA